jgi:hypothetical protein
MVSAKSMAHGNLILEFRAAFLRGKTYRRTIMRKRIWGLIRQNALYLIVPFVIFMLAAGLLLFFLMNDSITPFRYAIH